MRRIQGSRRDKGGTASLGSRACGIDWSSVSTAAVARRPGDVVRVVRGRVVSGQDRNQVKSSRAEVGEKDGSKSIESDGTSRRGMMADVRELEFTWERRNGLGRSCQPPCPPPCRGERDSRPLRESSEWGAPMSHSFEADDPRFDAPRANPMTRDGQPEHTPSTSRWPANAPDEPARLPHTPELFSASGPGV